MSYLENIKPSKSDTKEDFKGKIEASVSSLYAGNLSLIPLILKEPHLYKSQSSSLINIGLFEAIKQNNVKTVKMIVEHPIFDKMLEKPVFNAQVIWQIALSRENMEVLGLLSQSNFKDTLSSTLTQDLLAFTYRNGHGPLKSLEFLMTHTKAACSPYLDIIDNHYAALCETYKKLSPNSNQETEALDFYEKYKILREQYKLQKSLNLTSKSDNKNLLKNQATDKIRKI